MKQFRSLLVAAFACGCVATNAALIDPSVQLAPTCPSSVRLYTTPDRVGHPYREIAVLNAKGESNWSDEGDMIQSMREKAADVGANGLILSKIDEPSALTKVIGEVAKTGSQRKGNAMAIYVPSDSTTTTTVCANARRK
jgi:hypothetical protein